MHAARFEALQCGGDLRVRRSLRAVRLERVHLGRLAHDRLDLVAAARLLDVARKGPLAHAPVLHRALARGVAVAGHGGRAPVGLPGDVAKIGAAVNHVCTRGKRENTDR
jgi:hypothetical protein